MNNEPSPSPMEEELPTAVINQPSKAALARHLTMPHGGVASRSSLNELRQWKREALNAEHERLKAHGPCPEIGSFRDRIVEK